MRFLNMMVLLLCFTIVFGPPIAFVIAVRKLWLNRCRIHLSTTVVLVMLTGALLGANLSKGQGETRLRIGSELKVVNTTHCGFPFRAHTIAHLTEAPDGPVYGADVDDSCTKLDDGDYFIEDDILSDFVCWSMNVSIGLAILSWAWLICELHIQKSESEKGITVTSL